MKYLVLIWSIMLFVGCNSDDSGGGKEPKGDAEGNAPYVLPKNLADYYDGVDLSLKEDELYDEIAVHTISKHTTTLSYTDRHAHLYDADADISNPDNVVLIYSGESRDRREWSSPSNPHSPQTFNTEHVYPQSMLDGTSKSDLHILRVVDETINGQRSNHPYTDGEGQYALLGDSFYPGDEWKGDVARMLMYMNIRYDEPFNDVGSLELFLEWNAEDPVSFFEIQRNEIIERAQGNRNPFIDNPHLATTIWGGEEADNRWDGENEDEDSEAPSAPQNLSVEEVGFETITLTWEESTDNDAVAKYEVLIDGDYHTSVSATNVTLTYLDPGTTYSLSIIAADRAANKSEESEPIKATTLADDEAPSVPTNLEATATATSVRLSWNASTDNAGVKSYDLFMDGEKFRNVPETEYVIPSLDPETTYSFTVQAIDKYDNVSEMSASIEVTTQEQTGEAGTASVIISEYSEGSSGYNKALEIANIGSEPVDLSSYSLWKITNDQEEWKDMYQLEGSLAAGEVLVIVNSKADYQGMLDAANDLTDHQIVNFNGNDPIGLFHDGTLVDMVGNIGGDYFAENVNLRRKSEVNAPNATYTPDEWEEYSDENTEGLGNL